MKNKKLIEYFGKDLINNPSLLLNKFEYYVNSFDDRLIFLFYYYKIHNNIIYYYDSNCNFYSLLVDKLIKDYEPEKKYIVF